MFCTILFSEAAARWMYNVLLIQCNPSGKVTNRFAYEVYRLLVDNVHRAPVQIRGELEKAIDSI